MDKELLSATWGTKQYWKLLLKLRISSIFALLVPHWQHENTAAADLPSTSEWQISQPKMGTVSSVTPALLPALRDPISPPAPSVCFLMCELQSHCLILLTALKTSGHSHCSLTLELSCWFADGTISTVCSAVRNPLRLPPSPSLL